MKKYFVQTWKSSDGESEIQHFLNDRYGTYVFGINAKLLGKDTYKKVKQIIDEAVAKKSLGVRIK